ncbi:MAG: sigma-70 family RNA polymerase sigma factor [Duncaniella sp.]|nr:sigma-70 family RNA polymerase sigma factor [Duncaniella sp.]
MKQHFLTQVFTDWRGRLRSLASSIAGDEDADDVVSEAFCRLWSRKEAVADEREAIRLSYAAVRNGAIDAMRRSKSHSESRLEETDARRLTSDESDEERERAETYQAVISLSRRLLKGRQLEIFTLHDVEGRGYEEIALALGLTESNVRLALSRARKVIRTYYNSTR